MGGAPTDTDKKYGLDRILQGEFDVRASRQKEFILRVQDVGGWAKVLGIDPHSALFLQKGAQVNNGATW